MEDFLSKKDLRVDHTTGLVSIISVIRRINNIDSSCAGSRLGELETSYPHLRDSIKRIKINGKGHQTPCVDMQTLLEIVWLLPSKCAKEFRRKSCYQICRLIGGDESLIPEIEARSKFWSSTLTRMEQREQLLKPMKDFKHTMAEERVREKDVQMELAETLKGTIEVRTESGDIDVLTEKELIEVKVHDKWKNAVGQVLAYGMDYPTKRKRIHLFGDINDAESAVRNTRLCVKLCNQLDIDVTLQLQAAPLSSVSTPSTVETDNSGWRNIVVEDVLPQGESSDTPPCQEPRGV